MTTWKLLPGYGAHREQEASLTRQEYSSDDDNNDNDQNDKDATETGDNGGDDEVNTNSDANHDDR